jgi:N-acetylglutamate synthase-like GNAT family acetyltransferase
MARSALRRSPPPQGRGVGAQLVAVAIAYAQRRGFPTIYLYTSGTLPDYYARLGWEVIERVEYFGRERSVMRYVAPSTDPTETDLSRS